MSTKIRTRTKSPRGDLVPLRGRYRRVPDAGDEALRDLGRARTDAVKDLRAARFRLKAFLLRHGYKYSGQSSWTPAHMRYLRELVLPAAAHKIVREEYLLAITQASEQ